MLIISMCICIIFKCNHTISIKTDLFCTSCIYHGLLQSIKRNFQLLKTCNINDFMHMERVKSVKCLKISQLKNRQRDNIHVNIQYAS